MAPSPEAPPRLRMPSLRVEAGGVESLPVRLEQPGLLGVDTRRRRLLVPLSSGDRLHVEPL